MLKELALTSYYVSTLRARQRAAALRAAEYREPVQILFYHRVADVYPNAWTMPTRMFARQVDWLRRHFDIVSLSEAQRRISSGRNDRPTACITFDDGYAENRHFAIPYLLRYQIPFTCFVSTNHVLGGESFPHDVAAGRPLPVNTLDHLRQMASAGVEIGAHTRSHPNLGASLTVDTLRKEIAGSKSELEEAIECEVRYFAFPYGLHENLSTAAFRVAVETGFAGVCSAYGGYNFPGDDAFHLRRFHADCEFVRFKNWLTIDPRKLRLQQDFDPGDYRVELEEFLAEAQRSQRELDQFESWRLGP
jgi:peptidoglycan/xylan/chitin deacetylase (PgdA/CDA1 family)